MPLTRASSSPLRVARSRASARCVPSVVLSDVAVKITPTSVVRSACKEVTALTRLNNAHIVQLLGVQVDMADEKVYMVMEVPLPATTRAKQTPASHRR